MQKVKRLFSVFLALAMLLSVMVFPAKAANDYELTVLKMQKLSDFDRDDPGAGEAIKAAKPGDIVVLTVGVKNNSTAPLNVTAITANLSYDTSKISLYSGVAPFRTNPYLHNAELRDDLGWNYQYGTKTAGVLSIVGAGTSEAVSTAAANGGEIPLAYVAFQVSASATEGTTANFVCVDTSNSKSNVKVPSATGSVTLEGVVCATTRLIVGDENTQVDDPPDDPGDSTDTPTVNNYELTVLKTQKLADFDRDDPGAGEAIKAAKPGDIVVMTVGFKNNSTAPLNVTAITANLSYDTSKVSLYSGVVPFRTNAYLPNSELRDDLGWNYQYGTRTAGVLSIVGAGTSEAVSTAAANGGEIPLAYVAFQVSASATEGTTADFVCVDTSNSKSNVKVPSATGSVTLEGVVCATTKFIIGDAAPTTITLSPKSATLAVPSGSETSAQTFTATVKDQGGNVMAAPALTWAFTDSTVPGVSITSTTGSETTFQVTSACNVTAETTFTLTATAANNSAVNASATIKVTPGAANPLTVTLNEKASETVTLDGQNGANVSAVATVTADGTSTNVSNDATWTVFDGNGSEVVETDGVSVRKEGGSVYIIVAADAEVGSYTVRAAYDSKQAQATLTVERAAQAEITALTLTPSVESVAVPTGDEPAQVTFTVKNQNDEPVSNTSLTWKISPTYSGVDFNETNGTISVSKDTAIAVPAGVPVTVTATAANNVSNTATVTITPAAVATPPVLASVRLSADSAEVDGATATPETITATAVPDKEGEFTGVTWAFTKAPENAAEGSVTLNATSGVSVTVTIGRNATAGEYELTARQGEGDSAVSRSATITITNNTPVDNHITVSGGQASINIPAVDSADAVSAPFIAKDVRGNVIPSSALTWTIVEKTATGEAGEAVPYVSITPEGVVTVNEHAREQILDTHNASGLTGKTMLVTATRTSDNESASAEIVVRRADSTLTLIRLNGVDTVRGNSPLTVTVTGAAEQIIDALAYDQYGEYVDGTVRWEVLSGGSGLNVSGSGVTVSPSGNVWEASVVVSRNAQHGTYIIQATRTIQNKDGTQSTEQVSRAAITVERSAETVKSVSISGGQIEMEVPGKNATTANTSAPFTASVVNQYDTVMENANVQWSIADASGNTVPGVTIANGVVSVDYTAKDTILDMRGVRFTVSATAGDVTNTAQIQIVRAVPYLNDITLDGQNSVTVTIDGTQSATVQGAALDQYESPISGATWNVTPIGLTNNGSVTANSATQEITVERDAREGNYEVRAFLGSNAVGPKYMVVSRGTPVASSLVISGTQATIWIPGDGKDPVNSAPFVATVKDQFGDEMTGQNVVWSILDSAGAMIPGISIANGIVTVTNQAKNTITSSNYVDFKTMFITATSGVITSEPVSIVVGRDQQVLSRVQLNGADSPDSSGQRITVDYSGTDEQTVNATALDQYGSPFNGVSWSIFSYSGTNGVAIASDGENRGKITLSRGAVSGEYTVTARYASQNPTASFILQITDTPRKLLDHVGVSPAEVVLGTGGAISQATAYDSSGQPITSGVTWTVYPNHDSGVSIASDGKITVAADATPRIYVVTATPDSSVGTVTGASQPADFEVKSSTPSTPTIERVILNPSTYTLNNPASVQPTASAIASNNAVITSGITWTVTPENSGVTIDPSGNVTVTAAATAQPYTITAYHSTGHAQATLTVQDASAVTISRVSLTPTTYTLNDPASVQPTASAIGSNNAVMTSGITWTVTPENSGVTIDPSGNITVTAAATAQPYTVTASHSTGTAQATLTVQSATAPVVTLTRVTLSRSTVSPGGTSVARAYGSNNALMTSGIRWTVTPENSGVTINASGNITVTADATAQPYTVTASHSTGTAQETLTVVSDSVSLSRVTLDKSQVVVNGTTGDTVNAVAYTSNNERVSTGVKWTVLPEGNGVSISDSGVITVTSTASGDEYTITAFYGGEEASAKLTVINNVPVTPTPTLDYVRLDQPTVTIKSGEGATANAYAYNNAGTLMTSGVTWTLTPAGQNVSISDSGVITIASNAQADTYTVMAVSGAVRRYATLPVLVETEVEYQATEVDTDAVAGTQFATLTYTSSGVQSLTDQAKMKRVALSQALQQPEAKDAIDDNEAETTVIVSMEIAITKTAPLTLSVTPVYQVIQEGVAQPVVSRELHDLGEVVTISLNVPANFNPPFAKHTDDGVTYYEPVSYNNNVASWTQRYFSEVELTTDAPTITFNSNGGTAVSSLKAGTDGKITLPTTTRANTTTARYAFLGWYLNGKRVDNNSVYTKDTTLLAQWQTTPINTGGSSGGSSGGGSSSGSSGRSSGSSSSSSDSPRYNVSLSSSTGGSVSASSKTAEAYSIVTVVVTPDYGYRLETLTIKNKDGRAVDYTESNGTYSFEMPRSNVTINAQFVSSSTPTSNTPSTPTTPTNPTPSNGGNTTPAVTATFSDVPTDNFFFTAVQWAVERGITNGTTPTTFSPNQSCTRSQMVMFLWRSQGMPMPTSTYNPFTDVSSAEPYYNAMLWAIERGITNGTTATTFSPYQACTRAQMVMFLHRLAGRPIPTNRNCPFTDIRVDENYYEPMLWALERGITNGTTATTFSPYQACTRAQMVMFLYRYFNGK